MRCHSVQCFLERFGDGPFDLWQFDGLECLHGFGTGWSAVGDLFNDSVVGRDGSHLGEVECVFPVHSSNHGERLVGVGDFDGGGSLREGDAADCCSLCGEDLGGAVWRDGVAPAIGAFLRSAPVVAVVIVGVAEDASGCELSEEPFPVEYKRPVDAQVAVLVGAEAPSIVIVVVVVVAGFSAYIDLDRDPAIELVLGGDFGEQCLGQFRHRRFQFVVCASRFCIGLEFVAKRTSNDITGGRFQFARAFLFKPASVGRSGLAGGTCVELCVCVCVCESMNG